MHISNKKPKGWVSIKEILSERYSPLILQKLNNFMCNISEIIFSTIFRTYVDDLKGRMLKLEKEVEQLENSLLLTNFTHNESNHNQSKQL